MKSWSPSPANPRIVLIRPFLELPKNALIEYAKKNRICFREDRSNLMLDFQRNRIRRELLPLLKRKYQPRLPIIIRRFAEVAGCEGEFARSVAAGWLGKAKTNTKSGKNLDFLSLPVAVQRQVIWLQLREQNIPTSYDLVEALRGLNPCIAVPQRDSKGPRMIAVRDERGIVQFRPSETHRFNDSVQCVPLDDFTDGKLDFGGARIQWRIRKIGSGKSLLVKRRGQECFDADKAGTEIILRHWRAGDRFQPVGMEKPVKLQDLFVNQKVPRTERHRLLLATTAKGEIFWVENMRISERFKLSKATKRCLQWRWQRD
jgi:tRNA(Ile)-lysidine synthase